MYYLGVEQEWEYKVNGIQQGFYEPIQQGILNPRFPAVVIPGTKSAIRTMSGAGIYEDVREAEICTPPVRIRRGFTSELIHLVGESRNNIFSLLPQGKHVDMVGYSTHYNVSEELAQNPSRLLNQFGIAYQMLALDRETGRFRFRHKPGRREVTAEYIDNLEQLESFMLFYVASLLSDAQPEFGLHPIVGNNRRVGRQWDSTFDGNELPNQLKAGRDSVIPVRYNGASVEWSAHDYLKHSFSFLEPALQAIGTPSQIQVLAEYVHGDRKLLIDQETRDSSAHIETSPLLLPNDPIAKLLGRVALWEHSRLLDATPHLTWTNVRMNVDGEELQLSNLPEITYVAEATAHLSDDVALTELARIAKVSRTTHKNIAQLANSGELPVLSNAKKKVDSEKVDTVTESGIVIVTDTDEPLTEEEIEEKYGDKHVPQLLKQFGGLDYQAMYMSSLIRDEELIREIPRRNNLEDLLINRYMEPRNEQIIQQRPELQSYIINNFNEINTQQIVDHHYNLENFNNIQQIIRHDSPELYSQIRLPQEERRPRQTNDIYSQIDLPDYTRRSAAAY